MKQSSSDGQFQLCICDILQIFDSIFHETFIENMFFLYFLSIYFTQKLVRPSVMGMFTNIGYLYCICCSYEQTEELTISVQVMR